MYVFVAIYGSHVIPLIDVRCVDKKETDVNHMVDCTFQ